MTMYRIPSDRRLFAIAVPLTICWWLSFPPAFPVQGEEPSKGATPNPEAKSEAVPEDELVKEAADNADPSTVQRVLDDLLKRLQVGKLSDKHLGKLIDRALAIQADAKQPWLWQWGDLVEAARKRGAVSDQQWDQYVQRAIPQFHLRVTRYLSDNPHLFFKFGHSKARVGGSSILVLEYSYSGIQIGKVDIGKQLGIRMASTSQATLDPGSEGSGGPFLTRKQVEILKLPPGTYPVTATIKCKVYEEGKPDKPLKEWEVVVKDQLKIE